LRIKKVHSPPFVLRIAAVAVAAGSTIASAITITIVTDNTRPIAPDVT
jgi:hypothetical protein